MSGSFTHHVCHRCAGDGEIRSAGELWVDLVVCPECDGGGVLYEYKEASIFTGHICEECGCSDGQIPNSHGPYLLILCDECLRRMVEEDNYHWEMVDSEREEDPSNNWPSDEEVQEYWSLADPSFLEIRE